MIKSDYRALIKTIQWPYIRHNEACILHDALILLQTNKKLPKKMAQDVEFIIEKYA